MNTQFLRDFARNHYAWPGGYECLLVMHDGEVICHACTLENYRLILAATRQEAPRDSWRAVAVDVHWEGEPLYCAHCNKELTSEYGVPGDDQE